MSSEKLPLFLLQELPDITENISYPLKNSQRIKYTCFDVSKKLIAFGATSGGIYVFNRNPCELLQLIPSKDGAITRLSISPDERHIAFANGRGIVTVTACEQTLSGHHTSVFTKEHSGNEVTTIVWSGGTMLFLGDDIGKVSILQLPGFITKTIFQNSSQTIMSLDSRICQMDIKDNMLLVSTLTRCYICNTDQEQYRQIGQKLRDGEYGACFVNTEHKLQNGTLNEDKNYTEVKQFNIVDGNEAFAVSEKLSNVAIFCARPSSRLWEASIDGTVKRTHIYKQVLGRHPSKIVSKESYDNENVTIDAFSSENEGQSCNFTKIFCIKNDVIVSFSRDALYFLDIKDVDNTMWLNTFKNIIDCKVYNDLLYIWLQDGSFLCLRFMKIEKFLLKCYLDEKIILCAGLCALYSNFLLSCDNLSTKLHILAGLRDKIHEEHNLQKLEAVLNKFEILKVNDARQLKSGIYVLDNTYQSQALFSDEDSTNNSDENKHVPQEALQSLMDFSITMSDKLNTSKKKLKEKFNSFEEKMKNFAGDKPPTTAEIIPSKINMTQNKVADVNAVDCDVQSFSVNNDIIYKNTSQKTIELQNEDVEKHKSSLEKDKLCKSLYEYFKLSVVSKQPDLLCIADNFTCDIKEFHQLMLLFEEHCRKIGALDESMFAPNNIFLNYLKLSPNRSELLDKINKDEILYKYFVDSCIAVNMKTQKISNVGCECGFPLPYVRTNENPAFADVIDEFIEKQWSSQTREQCYDVCKKMPYLWRKIMYLRRHEDLLNILRLLLQILDENLLHTFLPHFTLETWDRAIQLYAVLHANKCLNCNKTFDHISVKQTLSWDDLGALIIKSVGGINAIKVMERHFNLIDVGDITVKFYHTCLLVSMYYKYDNTIVSQLTDTIYSAYYYEDAVRDICNLLRSTSNGQIKNTALPISVASKSRHWGLDRIFEKLSHKNTGDDIKLELKIVTTQDILDNACINNGNTDCSLCGLPLMNEVLIKDGGLWVFKCGHIFHGACLDLNKIKLCPTCSI